MVYDSVYYLPTHTVPQSEKRYIWNKKFKVYPLYLNSYYYRIDSVEHTVFWDGEIDELSEESLKGEVPFRFLCCPQGFISKY